MDLSGQDFWLQATQCKYSLSGPNSLAPLGGTAFKVRWLEEWCPLFHQTSSSVRICFGEWSKHPPSLSLLHFWVALKWWLPGIYIIIGGTPEIHYTSLWECMNFTSVAARTNPSIPQRIFFQYFFPLWRSPSSLACFPWNIWGVCLPTTSPEK